MKITKFLTIGSLSFLCGCSVFNEENIAGAHFASSKDEPRQDTTIINNVTTANGLMSVGSVIDSSIWNSIGICRTGIWEKDTFYACLNFHSASVPAGLDSLNGRFATDEMRKNYGIDSIKLDFFVVTGSAPSENIAGANGVDLLSFRREGTGINAFRNLGHFKFSQDTIVAPGDTGHIKLSIRNDSTSAEYAAYRYLVDSMLINRTTDSVSVPLALLQNSMGRLLTMDLRKTPTIKYFGRSIRRVRIVTPDTSIVTYRDSIMRDSLVVSARVMKTIAAVKQENRTILDNGPSLTSYEIKNAGRYQAHFDLSVDSLLKGLNPDSIVMLQGEAKFFTVNNADSSQSESRQSVDFLVYCHLLDSADERITVKGSGLYNISDTVAAYNSFEPWNDTEFSVKLNKQVVALTDPAFSNAKKLRLIVAIANRIDRSSLDVLAKVVFRKNVQFKYSYEKR
jgi:hypothetical protein